jgi:hypothetical protein
LIFDSTNTKNEGIDKQKAVENKLFKQIIQLIINNIKHIISNKAPIEGVNSKTYRTTRHTNN